ncbi:MAG: hypothetical protein FWG62_09845 [Proteobacteria bacterium]|nr:hypothetical protein [Pseudomonadota bacterium]
MYLRPLYTELYQQWDMTGVRFSIIGVVVFKGMRLWKCDLGLAKGVMEKGYEQKKST